MKKGSIIIWIIYILVLFFLKEIREYLSNSMLFLLIGAFIEYFIIIKS